MKVKDRLALRVIFGFDELVGLVFVLSAQARAFAGPGVHSIELIPSASPAAQSESGPCGFWRNRENR